MDKYSTLRTVLIIWLCLCQVALIVVGYIIARKVQLNWTALLPPFLKRQSVSSIELKIFSFDEAFEAKVLTDESGVVLTINKKAVLLLGYKKSELRGKRYEVLLPETEWPKIKEQMNREEGQPIKDENAYLTIMGKDKIKIDAEVSTIKKSLEGRLYYIIVIRTRGREINIIRQLQRSLEIYKLRLEICEHGEELNTTGAWIWDLKNDEVTLSQGCKRLLGMKPTDPNQVRSSDLMGRIHKDEKIVKEALDRAFSGKNYTINYRIRKATDFKILHVKSIVKPVNLEGVPIALKGAMTLISETELQ